MSIKNRIYTIVGKAVVATFASKKLKEIIRHKTDVANKEK